MVLPPGVRATRPELLKAALFFLLLAVAVMPRCLQGRIYLPGQYLNQYYPWRYDLMGERIGPVDTGNADLVDVATVWQPHDVFFSTWLKRGRLPLWDPTSFCGHPLLANGQSAMLYPPKLLLTWLFPPEVAHNLYLLFHVWASALLMYGWLRYHVRRPAAACLGAVAWALNGFLMVYLEAKTVLALGPLLPLMLLAAEGVVERPSARTTAPLALSVGLLLSCGMWQFLVYCLLIGGSYVAYRMVFAPQRWRIAVSALAAIGVGNLIGALQFWPAVMLSRVAERPTFSFGEHYSQNCFYPENLMTLLIPEFLGGPTHFFYLTRVTSSVQRPLELACHIGLVATLAALVAVFCRWRANRLVPFFAVGAVLAILCAMGTNVYWPLYASIPYMKYLTPTRIVFLVPICLSVLAGFGFEHLLELDVRARRRVAAWLLLVPVGCLAMLGYTFHCFQAGAGPVPAIISYCEQHGILLTYMPNYMGVTDFTQMVLYRIWEFYRWTATVGSYTVPNFSLTAPPLLGLVFIGVLCCRLGPRLKALLVGLTALELLLFAWAWNPTVAPGSMYRPFGGLDVLKTAGRTIGVLRNAHPDALTAYGIRDAAGYDTYYLGRYRHLFDLWQGAPSPGYQLVFMAQKGPLFHTLANLLGIDLFYSDPLVASTEFAGFPCVYRREIAVYRNPEALPRMFLVTRAQVAVSDDATLQAMAAPGFDPGRTVLLESAPTSLEADDHPGTVDGMVEEPDRIEAQVNARVAAIMVMSDTWDDGWHATVDEREVPVLRADFTLRAVEVPPGQHRLVLYYLPRAVLYGGVLTVLGLICLVGLWTRPGLVRR